MTKLTVRLPNSVHQKVKELALRDEISVNQFIAAAVSEKMASVMTPDYLKAEAAKASRSDFDRFIVLDLGNANHQSKTVYVLLANREGFFIVGITDTGSDIPFFIQLVSTLTKQCPAGVARV